MSSTPYAAKPTTPMPLDQLLFASTGSIDLDDGECNWYSKGGWWIGGKTSLKLYLKSQNLEKTPLRGPLHVVKLGSYLVAFIVEEKHALALFSCSCRDMWYLRLSQPPKFHLCIFFIITCHLTFVLMLASVMSHHGDQISHFSLAYSRLRLVRTT